MYSSEECIRLSSVRPLNLRVDVTEKASSGSKDVSRFSPCLVIGCGYVHEPAWVDLIGSRPGSCGTD